MHASPSLKARAISLLSRREHSVAELKRKLLGQLARQRKSTTRGEPRAEPAGDDGDQGRDGSADPADIAEAERLQVDEVVAWLQAHDYLSEDRFIEGRLHARASRFGNLRLKQELAQHGLSLPADAAESLQASELERARAVWQRKYGALAAGAADLAARAKQARFLAARGFSADVIRAVLRSVPRPAAANRLPDDEMA
jgi:regulatory protein